MGKKQVQPREASLYDSSINRTQAQLSHINSSNTKRERSLQGRQIHLEVQQNYHQFLLPKRPAPVLSNSYHRDHEFNGHCWNLAIPHPTRGINIEIHEDHNLQKNRYYSAQLKRPLTRHPRPQYPSHLQHASHIRYKGQRRHGTKE